MGIVLSKLWERLFSGKNYKIIILGAMSRRSSPLCLLCRYPAPSPRGRGMAKAVAGGSAVSSPLHGAPPGAQWGLGVHSRGRARGEHVYTPCERRRF